MRSALAFATLGFLACGDPEPVVVDDYYCDPVPALEEAEGWSFVALQNQNLQGTWQHTATLLTAPDETGLPIGSSTDPTLVHWVVTESRLDAVDERGPLFGFEVQHVDLYPRYSRATGMALGCPSEARRWDEREYAMVDRRDELVTAPLALGDAFIELEADDDLFDLRVDFDGERSVPATLRTTATYHVVGGCERCGHQTEVLVEHRLIRRFDLD